MKIFIFKRIAQVSDNWHPEWWLVIIAENKEKAMELIEDNEDIEITEDEWETVHSFELKDEWITPRVRVMEDAGCC